MTVVPLVMTSIMFSLFPLPFVKKDIVSDVDIDISWQLITLHHPCERSGISKVGSYENLPSFTNYY